MTYRGRAARRGPLLHETTPPCGKNSRIIAHSLRSVSFSNPAQGREASITSQVRHSRLPTDQCSGSVCSHLQTAMRGRARMRAACDAISERRSAVMRSVAGLYDIDIMIAHTNAVCTHVDAPRKVVIVAGAQKRAPTICVAGGRQRLDGIGPVAAVCRRRISVRMRVITSGKATRVTMFVTQSGSGASMSARTR